MRIQIAINQKFILVKNSIAIVKNISLVKRLICANLFV